MSSHRPGPCPRSLRSAPARILAALTLALIGVASAVGVTGAAVTTALPSCELAIRFDRGNFSNPLRINNRFLPMKAGTQWTLEGRANRTGTSLPHQVVF